MKKVALLCGNGELPYLLIEKLKHNKTPYCVIRFKGLTEEDFSQHEAFTHGLGKVGAILKTLRNQGVSHLVMAGALRRPSFSELKVDAVGAKWLTKLGLSFFSGDDALLRRLILMMEEEGFKVISPHEILKDLLSSEGLLTQEKPSDKGMQDIRRGLEILKALDKSDVGQAVVVQQGLVLGIEAIEGTAELLKRIHSLKREGFGGVLIKRAKSHQSQKVDLPTIGLDTVEQVINAGLAGIAISAHTTQILDKEKVLILLNEHRLFLFSFKDEE